MPFAEGLEAEHGRDHRGWPAQQPDALFQRLAGVGHGSTEVGTFAEPAVSSNRRTDDCSVSAAASRAVAVGNSVSRRSRTFSGRFYNLERILQRLRLEGRSSADPLRQVSACNKLLPLASRTDTPGEDLLVLPATLDPDCRAAGDGVRTTITWAQGFRV